MVTEQEIAAHKKKIDEMSHEELVRLWRFAPVGHIYFNNQSPLFFYFKNRLDSLGGITPEISKKVGW